jgi:hypothetical protein
MHEMKRHKPRAATHGAPSSRAAQAVQIGETDREPSPSDATVAYFKHSAGSVRRMKVPPSHQRVVHQFEILMARLACKAKGRDRTPENKGDRTSSRVIADAITGVKHGEE